MNNYLKNIDVDVVLDRLKQAYGLNSDRQLASVLDVASSTVSTWRARKSVDLGLVALICENINFKWLITGYGEMFHDIGSAPVGAVYEEATEYDSGELNILKKENENLKNENYKLQAKVEVLTDVVSSAIQRTEKAVRLEPTPSKQRLATIPSQ